MSGETRIPSFCAQCRSRCGCTAVVADGRLQRIEPDPTHPSGEKLCPKGRAAPELVYHPDRLTRPMRRLSPRGEKPVRWEPISWDQALDTIAAKMAGIRDEHGAEQVAFSVTTGSGTHISDGISWIERFIRAYGSPNTIYSTEICNWHKDVATRFTYGWDIGTPDFAGTDCVLLWGHNPSTSWLARAGEVGKAVKRGAKLLVVDPRPTVHARRADCWLQVRPGTDQVLALGLARLMIASKGFDHAFARRWTNAPLLVRDDTGEFLTQADVQDGGDADIALAVGPDGYVRYHLRDREWLDPVDEIDLFARQDAHDTACKSVLGRFADMVAGFTPARVEAITGVAPDDLQAAAELIAQSNRVAYYAWNGVGQSLTATQTDRALSILYALTGSYGDRGGNVPGGAAAFNDISGQALLSDEQRAKALGLSERPLGPARQAWVTARDVYTAVTTQKPYPVRMLFSFGGNLLSAQPDTVAAKAAMDRLELHVHADFFLNATAERADIVLPVASSWEREALRNGFDASLEGMRRVQLRPAAVPPVGEARSDTDIVIALAQRLGLSPQMFDGDVRKGHAEMLAPSGLSLADLEAQPEGVILPDTVPLRAYEAQGFPTESGLIEIYSTQLMRHGQPPLPEWQDAVPDIGSRGEDDDFPLHLSCAKTVAYCHSQGRNIPSLRRLHPDPVIEIAPETARAEGMSDGDWVRIETAAGCFVARARLVRDLRPGTVFTQHGWTQDDAAPPGHSANMNAAMSTDHADPVSGSIPLRSSRCRIRPIGGQA